MKNLIFILGLLALIALSNGSDSKNQQGPTDEFCDHTGINPIGSCKEGKKVNDSCVFDRHCRTKNCHLFKCVSRKPVRDGPCTEDTHSECIPEQYCSSREKTFKCRDRKCSGMCSKDAHCLSNKCSVLFCKKPEKGCKETNSTSTTTTTTTKKPKRFFF
ncbi:unnamed protein product [Brachionus calyciflorus]|uniref:Uncharacterized protein n=1 Tax=Brachionus calyciflorus TaxID=104777 RepID=A0A814BDZ4_9BILA|nr:unnamed protein product [Brachionus calyciflorus]